MTEAADEHNSKWGKAGLSKATALQNRMSPAITAYRKTYETYPESSFAAEALGRVVRHYVDTENFAQAADLLESVFTDYPDAAFLDEMLLLWANVGFRMGDNETAKAKLQQLIFDYPTSKHRRRGAQEAGGLWRRRREKEEKPDETESEPNRRDRNRHGSTAKSDNEHACTEIDSSMLQQSRRSFCGMLSARRHRVRRCGFSVL